MNNLNKMPDQAYLEDGEFVSSPPIRYAGITFADFIEEHPAATAIVGRYVDGLKPGCCTDYDMYLSAPSGAGKTETAIAVMGACQKKNIRAVFVGYTDLVTGLTRSDDPDSFLSQINAYDLLIIDDFGEPVFNTEKDVVEVAIFRLIDQRFTQCKQTMLVSSFLRQNIDKKGYGVNARIMSRIRGSVVEIGWEA